MTVEQLSIAQSRTYLPTIRTDEKWIPAYNSLLKIQKISFHFEVRPQRPEGLRFSISASILPSGWSHGDISTSSAPQNLLMAVSMSTGISYSWDLTSDRWDKR